MACYVNEDDVWKCPKHPSRRRKTGICPTCLRDRLVTLCPECANLRPCSDSSCAAAAAATSTTLSSSSSSSSSSASSFSLFSIRGSRREPSSASASGVGEVGRVSNLIETEPVFSKSRSLAIPFLRSRSRFVGAGEFSIKSKPLPPVSRSKISFWSVFKLRKVHKGSDDEKSDEECKKIDELTAVSDYSVMTRSRSVAIGVGAGLPPPPSGKQRGWYFPSPMNVFRSTKTSKVVQERSPLHRG